MKYIYKNTGIVVESGKPLDSAIFIPVEEKKKAPRKRASKKGAKTCTEVQKK